MGFCLPPAGKLDASAGSSVRGRLRLCSMSLFFDPDEQRLPILRFPFAHCEAVERDATGEAVCLASTHWLRLKENGVDSPYVHDKAATASVWRFSLAFASLAALLVRPRRRAACAAHRPDTPPRRPPSSSSRSAACPTGSARLR